MKRLMLLTIMFLSFFVQADDTTNNQSSSNDSKKSDDISISIENVHHINLDTTQVDGGGNWLNKRMWYERAQTVFDEIRSLVNSVGDLRIQFSQEVNTVGRKIDSFYESVSFKKEDLDIKFQEILASLNTEQKIIGDLSAEERNLQVTVKQEIQVIEQIGKDIASIGKIDAKIDDTNLQALKTVDECRDYETKAWETFKSIGKELDDKKARNLYYQMNNYKQNIDQKINYLRTQLLPYLHNVLVAKIDSNISKINQSLDQLKEKGVDVQKIMDKTQEDDLHALQEKEKAATELAVRKALEKEEEKSKKAADLAAQKAAKELADAQANSFTNVVNRYYGNTIGKFINYIHDGFLGKTFSHIGSYFTEFFASYSYPVLTYFYHILIACKDFIQNFVYTTFAYYHGAPVAKKVKEKIRERVEEKIEERIADQKQQETKSSADNVAQENIKPVDNNQTSSIDNDNATVKNSVDSNDSHNASVAAVTSQTSSSSVVLPETSTQATSVQKNESASAQSNSQVDGNTASSTTSTSLPNTSSDNAASHTATPQTNSSSVVSQETSNQSSSAQKDESASTGDNVTVQSLSQDTDEDNITIPYIHNFYQIFKSILDFIGTVFVSIYNCIAQFFKLIWSISTYVAWMN